MREQLSGNFLHTNKALVEKTRASGSSFGTRHYAYERPSG